MTAIAEIPVEQLTAGQRIFVSNRIGLRRVLDVLEYDTLGLEKVDCFVVLYDPPGPGMAYENRSGMRGVVVPFRRDCVSLRPLRRGELVRVERLHLVERN